MGWSEEVHTNRLTEASLHAKRRARLQRANKLPEAEGSASSPVLLTAAGAILTAILLRQDGNQKQLKRAARNILDHIANLLPQTPTRVRTAKHLRANCSVLPCQSAGVTPMRVTDQDVHLSYLLSARSAGVAQEAIGQQLTC